MTKKVKLKNGDRIQWKIGGAKAKEEGMAGKKVWGEVKELRKPDDEHENGVIVVLADYRNAEKGKLKKGVSGGVKSLIDPTQVLGHEAGDGGGDDDEAPKSSKKSGKKVVKKGAKSAKKTSKTEKPAKKSAAKKPAAKKGAKKPAAKKESAASFKKGQKVKCKYEGSTYDATVKEVKGSKLVIVFKGDKPSDTYTVPASTCK